ncbi:DEKNAAC104212 [Brettanomyces naardenensis]|uniref:ribose-phosphate diphosphokinase n=1 Tax=Brettanomyces naardenensis TaxID=13370 RepID=A0A448YQ49_BRENA|nr:DEKNAAC104212 [Brettanomyces naardenensis]
MRDIVVFSGSSNKILTERICENLGLVPGEIELMKFANGETSVRLCDSVREKDVLVIQSGCGRVNDNFMELLLMISACKMASAKRITVVCPLFFYSRQAESPSSKKGVPFLPGGNRHTLLDSVPPSPRSLSRASNHTPSSSLVSNTVISSQITPQKVSQTSIPQAQVTDTSVASPSPLNPAAAARSLQAQAQTPVQTPAQSQTQSLSQSPSHSQSPHHPYKSWVAQSGTLIANLLTSAGADHIVTMDLHDAQFQGFFDIPVDNLYSKPLVQHYIVNYVRDYKDCVIVSPDAGGAKRAAAIADSLGLQFALIHKERRQRVAEHPVTAVSMGPYLLAPVASTDDLIVGPAVGSNTGSNSDTSINKNASNSDTIVATTMLVGDVQGKVCVIVDDLVDTATTIIRAARLLKEQGCIYVYALITHGIFSGDALKKVKKCGTIDQVITTNTVDQTTHVQEYGKVNGEPLEVLDVSRIFAEAIRRINNGESVSLIYDQGW